MTETSGSDSIRNYLRWLAAAGIEAERIAAGARPPDDVARFDALLLTGGVDVNPTRYGEARTPDARDVQDERDQMESILIERFMSAGKPVLGVCRGIQILNVALGGKLIQHIPELVTEEHRAHGATDSLHPIRFIGESALCTAMKGVGEVNSAHHQAVHPDALGRGLRVTAVSPMGVVEAVEGDDLLAVQWHPERLPGDHPASAKLLARMIEMCRHGP